MEDNYYTPEIEEFYVGFEYEFTKRIGDLFYETTFSQSDFMGYENEEFILQNIEQGLIRVKYLDRADIESLGFEKFQTDTSLTSVLGNYIISFYPTPGNGNTIKITHSNGVYLTIVFLGRINNKSELKKLLKQLNILNNE